MSLIKDILDRLGVGSAPWVIRAYITVLIICAVLLAFGVMQSPGNTAADRLVDLMVDSFKIVLGAIIGALSMAAQARWGANQDGHRADKG